MSSDPFNRDLPVVRCRVKFTLDEDGKARLQIDGHDVPMETVKSFHASLEAETMLPIVNIAFVVTQLDIDIKDAKVEDVKVEAEGTEEAPGDIAQTLIDVLAVEGLPDDLASRISAHLSHASTMAQWEIEATVPRGTEAPVPRGTEAPVPRGTLRHLPDVIREVIALDGLPVNLIDQLKKICGAVDSSLGGHDVWWLEARERIMTALLANPSNTATVEADRIFQGKD